MSKPLSAFYSMVLPYVPGCPDPMLDQALLHSASMFCRDTLAVQEITTQHVIEDQPDYCVDTPTASQLVSVIGVWYADTKLRPVGIDEVTPGMAMRTPLAGYEPARGAPTSFYQKVPAEQDISLWPVPDVAISNGLAIRAAYEPSATATSLADVLFTTYGDDVAFGALGYLMMLPGQIFSNPLLGQEFNRKFSNAIESAKLTAKFGRMYRSARVRYRAFA